MFGVSVCFVLAGVNNSKLFIIAQLSAVDTSGNRSWAELYTKSWASCPPHCTVCVCVCVATILCVYVSLPYCCMYVCLLYSVHTSPYTKHISGGGAGEGFEVAGSRLNKIKATHLEWRRSGGRFINTAFLFAKVQ